jgi:FkbM family methyltransferase
MSRFCIVRGNIGTTALLFSKMVGAKGRVFVFEPVMYQTLRDNLRENKIENVEVIAAAVGDRDDQIEIHVSDFCLDSSIARSESIAPL